MLSIIIHLHCCLFYSGFPRALTVCDKKHFEAIQVFEKVRNEPSVRVLVLSHPISMAENYETYHTPSSWQFKFTELRFRNIRRSLVATLLHEVASTRQARSFA